MTFFQVFIITMGICGFILIFIPKYINDKNLSPSTQMRKKGVQFYGLFYHSKGLPVAENILCEVFLYRDKIEFKAGTTHTIDTKNIININCQINAPPIIILEDSSCLGQEKEDAIYFVYIDYLDKQDKKCIILNSPNLDLTEKLQNTFREFKTNTSDDRFLKKTPEYINLVITKIRLYSLIGVILFAIIFGILFANTKYKSVTTETIVGTHTICYITAYGKRYHKSDCSYVINSSVHMISIKEAKEAGYSACSRCKGPDINDDIEIAVKNVPDYANGFKLSFIIFSISYILLLAIIFLYKSLYIKKYYFNLISTTDYKVLTEDYNNKLQ